jgi:uncharacterized phage infection (PIP) family protein YhgE
MTAVNFFSLSPVRHLSPFISFADSIKANGNTCRRMAFTRETRHIRSKEAKASKKVAKQSIHRLKSALLTLRRNGHRFQNRYALVESTLGKLQAKNRDLQRRLQQLERESAKLGRASAKLGRENFSIRRESVSLDNHNAVRLNNASMRIQDLERENADLRRAAAGVV